MKILVLTSLNPILAGDVYAKIAGYFEKKNQEIDIICFPFFAEIDSQINKRSYIPSLFAMMGASLSPDLHKKIYRGNNTIVVGNIYKEEKFDIIVTYDDLESRVFDSYIEKISKDVAMKEFAEMARIDQLYSPEDATIHLPTLEHLNLFLSTSFDDENKKGRVV